MEDKIKKRRNYKNVKQTQSKGKWNPFEASLIFELTNIKTLDEWSGMTDYSHVTRSTWWQIKISKLNCIIYK